MCVSAPLIASGGSYVLRPATQVRVEYNVVAFEVRGKVAARGHEPGQRRAPSGWFWSPCRDVGRDAVTGEEPNRDVARCPLHYVNTTIDRVKSIPVYLGICRRLGATARGTAVTIGIDEDRASC